MVQQELEEGTIRAYGRELVTMHLRVHHIYRVHEDDVRDARASLTLKVLLHESQGRRKEEKPATNTSFEAQIGSGI
jgi:hypothetical protein